MNWLHSTRGGSSVLTVPKVLTLLECWENVCQDAERSQMCEHLRSVSLMLLYH